MYVCLFWHFHQPVYKDPESGQYVLPWVNYHSVKNYRQMAVLSKESGFPSTFNFVPCLLEQIEDYARKSAVDPYQEALETRWEDIDERRIQLLRLILPDGPRDRTIGEAALKSLFSPVERLGTSRESLLDQRQRILEGLLPSYKELWDAGVVELTVSAQYHPLLPLIFDLQAASEEHLPVLPFRHPEDGLAQIRRGRQTFSRIFGRPAAGFWPSEGGISSEVAAAVSGEGFTYAVTDENVLWKSGKDGRDPGDRMRPYECRGLTVFFRDRELSDLIGFEYQRWNEKDAVADLVEKLKARSCGAGEGAVTVIALDGENPWAGYRENGVPFLRELFARLGSEEGLVPITLSGFLKQAPVAEDLALQAGTWLGGFSKWVGHPSKNAAWEALGRAREEVGPVEDIFVAEGSDWFWWYGEPGTEPFDRLFRGYIHNAYRNARRPPPREG